MTMHQMMLAPPHVAGSPPATYVLRDINSDLGGGADFSRKLLTTTASEGSLNISVAGDATEISRGFTEPDVPGSAGLNSNITVEWEITSSAGELIRLSIQAHRVNNLGVVQVSSSVTAEQVSSLGVHTFNMSPAGLGTWGSTDRLRIDYRYRNTHPQGQTFAMSFNTANSEVKAE